MEQINEIFAKNVIYFRNALYMTQSVLGEKLNYSDKAVSRWERGEAIPDAKVLVRMSELFGVSVDDLLKKNCSEQRIIPASQQRINHTMISGISVIAVWTLALLIYIITFLCGSPVWLVYVYAVPLSVIVGIVFNSIWGRAKWNVYLTSLLIWSVLAAVCATAFRSTWLILLLLGIPLQIITVFSFRIRKHNNK